MLQDKRCTVVIFSKKYSIEVPSFLCSVTMSSCILVSFSVAIWNGPWHSLNLSCVLEALLGCLWVFISCLIPKLRDKNNKLYTLTHCLWTGIHIQSQQTLSSSSLFTCLISKRMSFLSSSSTGVQITESH